MLRPTFLSFETAKKALNVSQSGLDVVGQNIANVNTPGYTRQRSDVVSISSSGYKAKFQIYGAGSQLVGQGANVIGISQIRDPYLDLRYRNEAANYGELAVKNDGLTSLRNVIDEISKDGLHAELGEFLTDLTKFSNQPSSEELASVVRNSAMKFTQLLNIHAAQLETVRDQQRFDLDAAITGTVNGLLEQIAFLNGKIREDNIYGNPANELNDERNLLIDQLAEYLNIKVVTTPEKISNDLTIERLSIQLVDGTTTPPMAIDLVDHKNFNQLQMNELDDGSVKISLTEKKTGFPLLDDITGSITSGGVKGYIDLINGKGDYAGTGENAYRGVPYYQSMLDTFASAFAEAMNRINSISAAEAAASGSPPQISEYLNKNLFESLDGNYPITAANITVSENWMKNAQYITTTKLNPSEPHEKLDEFDNPVYDEFGNIVWETDENPDNINRFLDMLTGKANFTLINGDGYTLPLFQGSFQEYLVSMQTDLGTDQDLNTTLLTASDSVISGYADQRDSISGVNMEEEAINMMVFQNYYNAAARYMTTLDEALGTIIQSMGVVGR